jgi:hypothetical protein
MSHSSHHVKDTIEFVHVSSSLQVNTSDIMVSLDVVSLFTRVPLKEIMDLLRVAMGSQLSPVTVKFYMEDYEKVELDSAP